jgi:arylsulfatase A-like enzyme
MRTVNHRLQRALGLVLLGAATVAAGPVAVEAAPQKPKNLIIVSLDTLRADRLGCYGHPRPTSPSIDRIAEKGVVFDDASATSPWTKPSHASLLTGLYPRNNGAVAMDSVMRDDVVHIASLLKRHGFQTIGVVNNKLLQKQGLERGFEKLEYVEFEQGSRKGSPVTQRAIENLEQRDREKPLFAFVHYMDVHSDYRSLPKYEEIFVEPYDGYADGTTQQLYRFSLGLFDLNEKDVAHLLDLYDAGIRQLDDQLARLFVYLERHGLLADSLLVVLSDHGEEFLEHGSILHGHSQHQEVIRIPLIFHGPGVPVGARVAAPVSLIDIMPTCLSLLDLPVPEGLDGVTIHELWEEDGGRLDPRLLYFEADVVYPPPEPGLVPVGPLRAVRDDRYKLHFHMETTEVLLFDLAADPGEKVDLAGERSDVGKRLWQHLRRFLEYESE